MIELGCPGPTHTGTWRERAEREREPLLWAYNTITVGEYGLALTVMLASVWVGPEVSCTL